MSENQLEIVEKKIDPRVRRTRHMLQQAMCELVREKSFTELNIHDITSRADLNRATFYKHFTDKYDLLNSIVRERFQQLLGEALPESPRLNRENVSILIQTAYDYISSFHGSCSKVRPQDEQSLIMQQVQRQIAEVLLNWLRACPSRSTDTSRTPEMTALLASWTVFGPLIEVAWGHNKLPKQELIEQVKRIVYSMLEDHLTSS